MSCECDKKDARNYYQYYDTPEGCDIYKKMLVTARYGAITGIILSTHDVLMYSRAVGLGPMLKRFAVHTVPLALMGATFAGVANGMVHLRKKNDTLNYFIGGLACGPIVAYYLGSYHAVLLGGLALGIVGVIKKHAIDTGHIFLKEHQQHMGTVRSWRNDYTLTTDPRDVDQHTCGLKTKT